MIRLIYIVLLITITEISAQQTLVNNSFTVRDFVVENDSMFFIEKRDVRMFNLKKEIKDSTAYFIGGYGLKVWNDNKSNEIISVSNEFIRPVTGVRFYNKKEKKINDTFFYVESRCIDAVILKQEKKVILSLANKKIIIVDYSEKPKFTIIKEIETHSFARKIIYRNNIIYYTSELGVINAYNIKEDKKTILINCKTPLSDFLFTKHGLFCSTISGELIKVTNKDLNKTIKLDNDFFISHCLFNEKTLLLGSFFGDVYVIDIDKMEIIDTLSYHKRSVIKIFKDKLNVIYSSSIDRTIKKWIIKV